MRYTKLGMLLGLLASSCGDDSTMNDSHVVSTGDPGSESQNSSSTSGDVHTSGSTSESTAAATGTTNAMDGTATVGTTSSMDTTAGTSEGETGTGGTFPCGEMMVCMVDTQYCEQTVGGAIGNPPQYACMDLPNECIGDATCDCVGSVPCGVICEMIEGGVQVTCQAP